MNQLVLLIKSVIGAIIFFQACVPKRTPPPFAVDTLTKVLKEIHLLDARLSGIATLRSGQRDSLGSAGFEQILLQNGLTAERFNWQYQFMLDHPREMDTLYARILVDLTSEQAQTTPKRPISPKH
jgi:hypothetical protein